MEPHRAKWQEKGSSSRPARRISRRFFLFGGSAFVLGMSAVAGALTPQPTLTALVDTIIPSDEFGPSASETGAADAIWASISGKVSRQIRVRVALAWLNVKAGGSFAAASEDTRVALIKELSERPATDTGRRFYEWVRTRTMRHYYGDASRAKDLGFVGPPQPDGHPDPASPWKVHS